MDTIYHSIYDKVVILGDFNSEISEEEMDDSSSLYSQKSLIEYPTCFKNDNVKNT